MITRRAFVVSVTIPVTSGLVTSLARPGGNVTGLAFFSPELVGKCREQLKQAVPGVSRIAALWQPGATEKDMLKGAEVAARALGVQLQEVEARGPENFERAFSEMTRVRASALTVLPSNMKTAKALGLTIPPSLLLRADQVIE